MAKDRIPSDSVKIAAFAKVELDDLLARIAAHAPDMKVDQAPVLSAVVLAACALPVESVAPLLAAYWRQDEEFAAVVAARLRDEKGET